MKKSFFIFCFLLPVANAHAQTKIFADSIRIQFHIPELAYAVITSDTIRELHVCGIQRVNTTCEAHPEDLFRIGSNTKAITGLIAALYVKKNKLSWDTKFFDLFPELKPAAGKTHCGLTLQNLLTCRTRLFPYTYTYAEPAPGQFTGTYTEQRYQFAEWFFAQPSVDGEGEFHFSNLGYVAAGLMLEKVSGKPYKELVADLGAELGIRFEFGQPNRVDTLQPWGHNNDLIPEAPADNVKLEWLLAAGNITMSVPDYAKFIQLQLQGLKGGSTLLTKEEFTFLHFGFQRFAVGWFWYTDSNNNKVSYNIGNPGTFLSKVYVHPDSNTAYILISNAQTAEANAGIDWLYAELLERYNK